MLFRSMPGISADTTIIAAEIPGIGPDYPLSREKLSPVLALRFGQDFQSSLDDCEAILRMGGLGHTCVIFSRDDARILEFGQQMPAYRVLVNTSAPQGSVGITTNVWPSMTLGCGAIAGNSTSDNVGPRHLINIKRIAHAVRRPEEALTIPDDVSATAPAPALAAPAAVAATGTPAIPREAVEAVVERYLRDRGLAGTPAAPPPPAANVAADVVDRFLAVRRNASPGPAAVTCGCALPPPAEASPAPAPAAEPPPEPPVRIVDFVCERDVRLAIEEQRKIFIGPKTIVTPSAREADGNGDILILAERL